MAARRLRVQLLPRPQGLGPEASCTKIPCAAPTLLNRPPFGARVPVKLSITARQSAARNMRLSRGDVEK